MSSVHRVSIDPADLDLAYRQVVDTCLGVRPGETVLVVMDPERRSIGLGLVDAVRQTGAEPVGVLLSPNDARGSEPPRAVAAALREVDAFLAPCLPSLSHTTARKEASAAGVRGATLPGATLGMVARLMTADMDAVRRRSDAVASLLDRAPTAALTCPHGSNLQLDLRRRPGIRDDGDLTARGAFGNLPCGEGFISPLGADGVLAAHVLPTAGVLEQPVMLTVIDGKLTDARGGPPGAAEGFLAALDAHGPDARRIAELGVGTNENAQITGNILEDEKVLGTVHVAFGASAGIGGDVTVPVHLDVVVRAPTLDVDDRRVVEHGRFQLTT